MGRDKPQITQMSAELITEGGQVRKAHELRIRNEELGMKRQGERGENNHR